MKDINTTVATKSRIISNETFSNVDVIVIIVILKKNINGLCARDLLPLSMMYKQTFFLSHFSCQVNDVSFHIMLADMCLAPPNPQPQVSVLMYYACIVNEV